ncbi:MAG: hypothetical protein MHM6MM_006987, partial [Cercozoa sp. M6MM]
MHRLRSMSVAKKREVRKTSRRVWATLGTVSAVVGTVAYAPTVRDTEAGVFVRSCLESAKKSMSSFYRSTSNWSLVVPPPSPSVRPVRTLAIDPENFLVQRVWTRDEGFKYERRPGTISFLSALKSLGYEIVLCVFWPRVPEMEAAMAELDGGMVL